MGILKSCWLIEDVFDVSAFYVLQFSVNGKLWKYAHPTRMHKNNIIIHGGNLYIMCYKFSEYT